MKTILVTQPDFLTKSKDRFYMGEEFRVDVQKKCDYLTGYVEGLKEFLKAHKIKSPYESLDHGKNAFPNRKINGVPQTHRKMNSVRFTSIVNEIKNVEYSLNRLRAILTA